MNIDYDKRIPKYVHIYNWLIGKVEQGNIKVGDKIPTEAELARLFSVNRMTVRQALDELVKDEMIIRKRGKGTFLVSDKPMALTRRLSNIVAFHQDLEEHGIKPNFNTIEKEVTVAKGKVAESLGIEEGSRVLHVLRLLLADDVPVLIERNYLPYELFEDLIAVDLNTNLYNLLVEQHEIVLNRSEQTMSAVLPSDEERKLLNVSRFTPCMFVESVMYDQNDRPIELLYSTYRGDKYRFRYESGHYIYDG